MALRQGLLRLKHRKKYIGNIKNLLFQNHLAQMLEIWYRGFHSRALLSLLKWFPQVPKSSAAMGFGFELFKLL